MSSAARFTYEEIIPGSVYEFTRIITHEDGLAFARLSGNYNPLHCNPDFGKESQFGDMIVYGMLAGSLFSTLIGMYIPGRDSLCLKQTLVYRGPLFYRDKVLVRGTVLSKRDSIKAITLQTDILKNGEIKISGEAIVKILPTVRVGH